MSIGSIVAGALTRIVNRARSAPEEAVPYENFMAGLDETSWCKDLSDDEYHYFMDLVEDNFGGNKNDVTLSAAISVIADAVSHYFRKKQEAHPDMNLVNEDIVSTVNAIARGGFRNALNFVPEPEPAPPQTPARAYNVIYPDFRAR